MASHPAIDDILLMTYHAHDGSISGRTNLQKIMYFVGLELTKNKLENFNKFGYKPHYFGPYSGEIDKQNNTMQALGFVEESQCHTGRVDEKGFEICRFDYQLTPDGKGLAEKIAEKFVQHWGAIESTVNKIKQSGLDYVQLSIAAKSYFLLDQSGGESTVEKIVALADNFDWEVSSEQVRQAGNFLVDLGLIHTNEN